MHSTKVKVRLTISPDTETEVTAREALSLRAQGLLVPTVTKAAPAAAKEAAK